MHDAEQKMREALGLGTRRDAPAARQSAEPMARAANPRTLSDRPAASAHGSGHRHRFVQDGEVPVVLVNHAQGNHAQGNHAQGNHAHGNGSQPAGRATENRAAPRAAAAELTAERSLRERAERELKQLQSVQIPGLEAKLFHANLARDEAVAALAAERDAMARARAEWRAEQERLEQALSDERAARERSDHRLSQALLAATQRPATAVAERMATPVSAARVGSLAGEAGMATPRAKRPYTPRKRYPLADAADLNLESLPDKPTRRRAGSPANAAQGEPADGKANAGKLAAAKRPAKEPQPVKWWVKARAAR